MASYTITEEIDESAAEDLVSEVVALATAHLRILSPDAQESTLIEQYAKAAIAAAENYTGRDFLPRTWTFEVPWGGNHFSFTRGPARSYTVKDENDADIDLTGYRVRNDKSTRGSGLVIKAPGVCSPVCISGAEYDAGSSIATITVVSGFATIESVPADFLQFVLASCASLYEHRETASQQPATHQTWMPMYLLDSWRVVGMA